MLANGVTPAGIFDEDVRKHGSKIKGVEVISTDNFLQMQTDCEVIVAINTFVPIAAQLLCIGVDINNISIAFYGVRILSLASKQGDCPYFYVASKITAAIIAKSKHMGARMPC